MEKHYSREEIKKFLKERFNALSVSEAFSGEEDEYYVSLSSYEDFKLNDCRTVEVVSLKTAISNEADFMSEKEQKDFYKNLVEVFTNGEELLVIGAYKKLAKDLFYREF